MIVFGRFRAPCCFQTWSCLGPFGAARGVVFWRVFWRRSGGRFWSVSSRLWASLFWCASVAARRRAWRPCAAPLSFFVAAWCGGVARCGACGPGRCAAVRRVLCVRARGVPGAAFVFFIVVFFGARCAGVLLLRAPRALRFFFFGRVACLPGGFLFRFFVLFFCLFCVVFTSAPCRCVSVSVAASPPVLRAASLFSFSAALKKV